MKEIGELLKLNGRVYVYLSSPAVCEIFLKNAENEGFLFQDGGKPTEKPHDTVFALNRDRTLNYVGMWGHLAYKNRELDRIGEERLFRVDYDKYVKGLEEGIT